jgi:methionyl-tRNA synthetase
MEAMNEYRTADASAYIMDLARRSNKYIDETTPWTLAKDESKKDELQNVLYNLLECIRIMGLLLLPLIPESAKEILRRVDFSADAFENNLAFKEDRKITVASGDALFARVDEAKKLEEIEEYYKKDEIEEEEEKMPEISIDDFCKVNLIAGKITACEKLPKAKKLLKLSVFDGKKNRQVISGIALYYTPEELIGKTIVLVENLKPAKLCGEESFGMILAADLENDGCKVIFLDDSIAPGSKIR